MTPGRGRARLLHVCRILMVGLIVFCVHVQQQDRRRKLEAKGIEVPVEIVRQFFPEAHANKPSATSDTRITVTNELGFPLGFYVTTAPSSNRFKGYIGPTNTLIAFDMSRRVVGIVILDSRDSPLHVEDIRSNPEFMSTFNGASWDDLATYKPDAVSGATLTSAAIIRGIQYRTGGDAPSLLFPNPINVEEVKVFLPEAETLKPDKKDESIQMVLGASNKQIGTAQRTSPTTDKIMGYKGPTDTLMIFDIENKLMGTVVRHSFDHEPYSKYLNDDYYFQDVLAGLTIEELAQLDETSEGAEGVSGATMTSRSVFKGIALTAQETITRNSASKSSRISLGSRGWIDLVTIAICLTAIILSFTRRNLPRFARTVLSIITFVHLGFISTELLSQALFVGWSQNGVAWASAPGLAFLLLTSLLVPAIGGKQVYCLNLCPHGIAQQWALKASKKQLSPSRNNKRLLRFIPGGLILFVMTCIMFDLKFDLSQIEAFDAYAMGLTNIASLSIAVISIAISFYIPKAYCRFACPTGTMLDYLRFNSTNRRWKQGDTFTLIILLTFVIVTLKGHIA